jgi:hypothetical protein
MNKTLTIILFSIATLGFSQARIVPANIAKAFVKIHPKATILQWNDEPPIWEAKYQDGSEKGATSFNYKAEVVETELVIPMNLLPTQNNIPNFIKKNYPKEKIQRCEKITEKGNIIKYEIQITGMELVFDSKGKFLSEELD